MRGGGGQGQFWTMSKRKLLFYGFPKKSLFSLFFTKKNIKVLGQKSLTFFKGIENLSYKTYLELILDNAWWIFWTISICQMFTKHLCTVTLYLKKKFSKFPYFFWWKIEIPLKENDLGLNFELCNFGLGRKILDWVGKYWTGLAIFDWRQQYKIGYSNMGLGRAILDRVEQFLTG